MGIRVSQRVVLKNMWGLIIVFFLLVTPIAVTESTPRFEAQPWSHSTLPIDGTLDQYQLFWNGGIAAGYPDMLAQSFQPSMNCVTDVELLISKAVDTTGNLTISIRDSLDGPDLTSMELNASLFSLERSWIRVDLDDMTCLIDETYYIVFQPELSTMAYVWWGSDNNIADRYPRGQAWLYTDDIWSTEGFVIRDWCFKTFGKNVTDPPTDPAKPQGTTNGFSWKSFQYQTVSTDPEDNDIRYGWDWNGDDIIDEWTEYVASGETMNTSHMWERSGMYYVQVLAEDEYQRQSNFSEALQVNISNDPPLMPDMPYGTSIGVVGESYQFSSRSTDPENDDVRLGWDWDGDDDVDEWTEYVDSGTTISTSHVWDSPGTYYIKVKAVDKLGAYSGFSYPLQVIIVHFDNVPPSKPERPSGPSVGIAGRSYSFSSFTTDDNDDRIYYYFDWDDGTTSGWVGPYASGQFCNMSHIWQLRGSFQVKVKAKDEVGEESVWSDPLPISMPRSLNPYHAIWQSHIILRLITERWGWF